MKDQAEVISIRDNNIEKKSPISIIRDAIYATYEIRNLAYGDYVENLVTLVLNPQTPHENADLYKRVAKILVINFPELENMIHEEDTGTRFDEPLAEMIAQEVMTAWACGDFVNTALTYIAENYSTKFELYRLKLAKGAKHFVNQDHVVAVVKLKKSMKWYGFSPANIFNVVSDSNAHLSELLFRKQMQPEYELPPIFPSLNGRTNQRATDVIIANSYRVLLRHIDSMEGSDSYNSVNRWILSPFKTDPEYQIVTSNPKGDTFTDKIIPGNHPYFQERNNINVVDFVRKFNLSES